RGATFAEAVVPGQGTGAEAGAQDFVAYPPGSPWAGRVLAAGRWGINVSDDGGETYRKSGLWEVGYVGEGVGLVEGTGDGAGTVAIVGGYISGAPDRRVWASADVGETWAPEEGVRLPEGPPDGVGGAVAGVLPLGGPSA